MRALSLWRSRPLSRPLNRPRSRRTGAHGSTTRSDGPPALLLCLALVAAACGVLSPEEQLLTDFFEASRLHDTTVVARMSDVIFNPRVDGVVDAFDVERVEESPDGQSERVTVQAQVRGSDGRVFSRTLVATLRRQDGRWFISGLDGTP